MRQNVYTYPDDIFEPARVLAGWFDPDRAEAYAEGTTWDGNDNISLATGSQWNHETLYRTAGGRWVLNWRSQWEGSRPVWQFLTDDAAREWLLRNEYDSEDIARILGAPLEEERGPGRPEIGPAFSVRFPADLLAKVDAEAERRGVSRAGLLRVAAQEMVMAG